MTLRRRLKVIVAALRQEWHEKTCAECSGKWMAVGPQTDLIAICDHCELTQMEKFAADMNQKYQDEFSQGEVA